MLAVSHPHRHQRMEATCAGTSAISVRQRDRQRAHSCWGSSGPYAEHEGTHALTMLSHQAGLLPLPNSSIEAADRCPSPPLRCPRGVAPRPARTNLKHLITTLDDLAVLGIAFVSLNEGIDDATTRVGRLQMSVLGATAEFERARIVERVRAGMARAKANGKRLGRQPPPHQRRRPGARRPPVAAAPGRRRARHPALGPATGAVCPKGSESTAHFRPRSSGSDGPRRAWPLRAVYGR